MKTTITLLMAFIGLNCFAQQVKVEFEIKQKIEIDGHITKEPIFFKATLDGVEIYDKDKNQYQKRTCKNEKCDIVHLEQKYLGTSIISNWGKMTTIEYLAQ